MSFYKVFHSCSCVFPLLDLSPIVSLWIRLCALFLLSSQCPSHISRASDFYVLRHSALVFLGFVLV